MSIEIPNCIVEMQDSETRKTKSCDIRLPIIKEARAFNKVRRIFLGENIDIPFDANKTIEEVYRDMVKKITAKINLETAKQ